MWTQHQDKNSGKTYYYNAVTRQSVWIKPPDFDAPQPASESVAAEPAVAAVAAPAVAPVAAVAAVAVVAAVEKATSGNGWKEYTAPDSRKYYHKAATNTTQWTRPAEMDEVAVKAPAEVEDKAEVAVAEASASNGDDASKAHTEDDKQDPE